MVEGDSRRSSSGPTPTPIRRHGQHPRWWPSGSRTPSAQIVPALELYDIELGIATATTAPTSPVGGALLPPPSPAASTSSRCAVVVAVDPPDVVVSPADPTLAFADLEVVQPNMKGGARQLAPERLRSCLGQVLLSYSGECALDCGHDVYDV